MNIYELQKQGANVKKKTVTPSVLPANKINLNTSGLTPIGQTQVQPKKVVNINDLKSQGVPVVKKQTPEPGFLQSIAGGIINAPSKIYETGLTGLAAGVVTPIKQLQGQDTNFSEQYKLASQLRNEKVGGTKQAVTGVPIQPAKSAKDFGGAVLETGATAGSLMTGGGTIGTIAKGAIPKLGNLAAQGAATGFTRGVGIGMQEDKNFVDSLKYGAEQGAIEAVLTPVGGYVGEKVLGGIIKGSTRVIPSMAKKILPNQFQNATQRSQETLNKVLDTLSEPNISSPKVRSTIGYVRTQFPNLQEEVAIRSGQPIKTIVDGNKVKFQTANQAETIKQKAFKESQLASELASKYDNVYQVSKNEVINEIDNVLSQTKGVNVAELRAEMLKSIEKNFLTDNVKPSKIEILRKDANTSTAKYDEMGNLVGESDADSLMGEVYKNVLSKKIPDPQYQTALRNSADNFQLARLLNTLHNKTATAERGALSKTTSGLGKAIEITGKALPFQIGSPVEYLGKFIKAIPEFNSAERALVSREIEKLVAKANKLNVPITNSEQRVLNFIKRLEQSTKSGAPIQINAEDISVLKSLDSVKRFEEAKKFFNKPMFGFEIDETKVDLPAYMDKYNKAVGPEKNKILSELYLKLSRENRPTLKGNLPTQKVANTTKDTFLESPVEFTPKFLPKTKGYVNNTVEDLKYYDDVLKQETNKIDEVPEVVKKERESEILAKIEELQAEKSQRQAMLEINRNAASAYENLDIDTRAYTNMKNSGRTDMTANKQTDQSGKRNSTLRDLEAMTAGKNMYIDEAMDTVDTAIELRKKARESAGIRDLDKEIKALKDELIILQGKTLPTKKPTKEAEVLGGAFKGIDQNASDAEKLEFYAKEKDLILEKKLNGDRLTKQDRENLVKYNENIKVLEYRLSKDTTKKQGLISDELYNKSLKNAKDKLSSMNSGLRVDVLPDLIILATKHIDDGIRTVAELAAEFTALGIELTKKEIQDIFNTAKKMNFNQFKGAKLNDKVMEDLDFYTSMYDRNTKKFSTKETKNQARDFLSNNDIDIRSAKDNDLYNHMMEILALNGEIKKNDNIVKRILENKIAKEMADEVKVEKEALTSRFEQATGRILNKKLPGFIDVGTNNSYDAIKFTNFKSLTTKVLDKLGGRTTVSKQFISDLTNNGDVKQVEKDLIRSLLNDEPNTVNVADFTKKVEAELLPLKVKKNKEKTYDFIVLPDELRGRVKNYKENIYESPIDTTAGQKHFETNAEKYFGHTRIEDMADNETRRIIEVQSDLYQKGGLENEEYRLVREKEGAMRKADPTSYIHSILSEEGKAHNAKLLEDIKNGVSPAHKELTKLKQYSNPTAHFRMVREEIKKAAQDGKTKLQFPTGETVMNIQGLGSSNEWKNLNGKLLEPDSMKVGQEVYERGENFGKWIITEVLGDGKFKAVPKQKYEQLTSLTGKDFGNAKEDFVKMQIDAQMKSATEEFDISGKVDTNNAIYKFYNKELANYLKNNYKAVPVTDKKGVTWLEIKIDESMADKPVQAFSIGALPTISGITAGGTGAFKGLQTLTGSEETVEAEESDNPSMKKADDYYKKREEDVKYIMEGVGHRESGILKDPYKFKRFSGVKAYGDALGKYQVTEETLRVYSPRYLGRKVSSQEFLNSPELQDKWQRNRAIYLLEKGYTPDKIIEMNYTGSPNAKKSGVKYMQNKK